MINVDKIVHWFVKSPYDGRIYQKCGDDDHVVATVDEERTARMISTFPQAFMLARTLAEPDTPVEFVDKSIERFRAKIIEAIKGLGNTKAKVLIDTSTDEWLNAHPNCWIAQEMAEITINRYHELEDNTDKDSNKGASNNISFTEIE